MQHVFIPYALAFRRPVATGARHWRLRRGAWLKLTADDGRIGWGEAAPLAQPVDAAQAMAACNVAPVRDAAFDLAQLDLDAQRAGISLARRLGASPHASVACNALCFADAAAACADEAATAVGAGYTTLKIKVGAASPGLDIARVAEVRRRIGPGPRLRLDANGAWDEATALQVLRALADSDIEYVEDPVAGDASKLRSKTGVALAVDVRDLAEGWRVVRERSADALVLKPMVLGGPTPVRALALAAIDAGIAVVISSVFDSAIGVAGALHLAASLPGPERAHGLATVDLLEPMPVEGLEPPRAGRLAVPGGSGLGVRLRENAG